MTELKSCPLEILLRQFSGQWTLYILWVLCTNGSLRFGELRRKVDGISMKVLTERGQELFEVLDRLHDLALRWYGPEEILG